MKNRTLLISVIVVAVLAACFLYLKNKEERPRLRYAVKKRTISSADKKRLPAVIPVGAAKRTREPRIAIVMDDFGYNKNNLEIFFTIKEPITLSVLPGLRYSGEVAREALSHGREVILHLPLEAHRKDVKEEIDTIRSGMKEGEITERLKREISSVPGIDGVSNHMGSKATEDKELMTGIFKYLKAHNLYFFDSLTSEESICGEAARSVGIPYARRDIFLDNINDPSAIEQELRVLKKMALKRGRAIAVCHDRKNTVTVLAKVLPEMTKEGIKFVRLSELLR